jgi:hypothetical protein
MRGKFLLSIHEWCGCNKSSAINSWNLSSFSSSYANWKWCIWFCWCWFWAGKAIIIGLPIWWTSTFLFWCALNHSLIIVEFVTFHNDVLAEIFVSIHSSGELSKSLVIMELISFHDNVLAEIFVSIHSSGELSKSLVIMELISFHNDVLAEIFVSIHTCSELCKLLV